MTPIPTEELKNLINPLRGGSTTVENAKQRFEDMSSYEQKKIQEEFEQVYGSDKHTRTRKQWDALVKKYTIDTVCKMEGITKAYVKEKLRYGKL